jgi:hypothetical protein
LSEDYRFALARQFEQDGDEKVAVAIRQCIEEHPEGCDLCEFLADFDDDEVFDH